VHIEETFDVIKRAHIATGHGGRHRMVKELGKKYANVTRDSIELFKSRVITKLLNSEQSCKGKVKLISI
jgi:hypothetical protein